jgi:hypothetical protein
MTMKGLAIFGAGTALAVAAALVATTSSQSAIAEGLKVPPAALAEKSSGGRDPGRRLLLGGRRGL